MSLRWRSPVPKNKNNEGLEILGQIIVWVLVPIAMLLGFRPKKRRSRRRKHRW